jgi:hypothetical protein
MLVVLLLAVIAAPARAQTPFRDESLHWQVQLPQGWTSDPSMVDTATALAKSHMPAADFRYVAAFKGQGNPYVLVQYTPVPMTGADLDQIEKKFEKGFRRGAEQVQRDLSDVVTKMEPGKPVLDRSRNRIISRIHMTDQSGRDADALMIAYLTKDGTVQLNCYAPSEEFEAAQAEFDAIANSLQIDPAYAFVPAPADRGMPRWIAFGALSGAIGVGIQQVSKRLKRKREARTN